jgi:hypothetical protein
MKNFKVIAYFLFAFFCALNSQAGVTGPGKWAVSIQKLSLNEHERITAFKVNVKGGRILTLAEIPEDWSFQIKNEGTHDASLAAGMIHGAAALSENYFNAFIMIEKKPAISTGKFDILIEVFTVLPDESERSFKLSLKDLKLNKMN